MCRQGQTAFGFGIYTKARDRNKGSGQTLASQSSLEALRHPENKLLCASARLQHREKSLILAYPL